MSQINTQQPGDSRGTTLPVPIPLDPTPSPFPLCAPPDTRLAPQFKIQFRRPIHLKPIANLADQVDHPLTMACVSVEDCSVDIALDPRFEQMWTITGVAIGDLASTMSLAPGEVLTLEFQNTQRKVFDKNVVDSAEATDSAESLVSDKESVNVTRASSRTENWHIDGTGGVSLGGVDLNASAGYSKNITDSNTQAISHITETTKKSAHSLKMLHKIEVRGVSEQVVTNRMTRVVRNPYPDRTMSINVFQLVKHFSIDTAITESWAALIVRINRLRFDNEFVVANTDFLRGALLDSSLIDDLSTAVQGAQPLFLQDASGAAAAIARSALRLLFDDPHIDMFNAPPGSISTTDPNLVSASFDASVGGKGGSIGHTGLGAALEHKLEVVFAVLNFYYSLYLETTTVGGPKRVDTDDDAAIRTAVTLSASIAAKWDAASDFVPMDVAHYGEIYRRVSGFLAMISGMLSPMLDPANQEKADLQARAKAMYVLKRLLQHLGCNQNYYIQEYIRYLAKQTENQAIIDFLRQVLANATVEAQLKLLTVFQPDIDRSFSSTQELLVPGLNALSSADMVTLGTELGFTKITAVGDPTATSTDVEVPTDGIHLEVAEGACILQNVPTQPASLTLSLQGLNLTFSGDGAGDGKDGDDDGEKDGGGNH